MREIKFKAKRIDCSVTVEGHYTEGSPGYHYITNPDGTVWQVDPKTVRQFTGRMDIHNVEIYEGDECVGFYAGGSGEPYINFIRWDNEEFGYSFANSPLWTWEDMEVIGSKFDE